jgi:hypothetical protein
MNYHQFRVFNLATLTVHPKGFWFKIFQHGLSFDWDFPVLGSERNGYRKVHRFGRLAVQVLKS